MEEWKVESSLRASNTYNPIYELYAQIAPIKSQKSIISLIAGDPSVCSDFKVKDVFNQQVQNALWTGKGNGYELVSGNKGVRQFMAQKFSTENIKLTDDQIALDFGGSGAIHSIMHSMLNEGDNILLPSPGYPLYETIAVNMGCNVKYYKLKPQENWEIDFEDLSGILDERSKLIVVINPSNPCGSVFSRDHLVSIIDWARTNRIPILSDEVYSGITFGKPMISLGELTDEVPVFVIGSLSKLLSVPGWRCGWALIYDKYNRCAGLIQGMNKHKAQVGAIPSFMQLALPEILNNVTAEYLSEVSEKLRIRANLIHDKLNNANGLILQRPDGAMYFMVIIDPTAFSDIPNSKVFAEKLSVEEGVLICPAECFRGENAFRIVTCNELEILNEAMDRIVLFVERHKLNI